MNLKIFYIVFIFLFSFYNVICLGQNQTAIGGDVLKGKVKTLKHDCYTAKKAGDSIVAGKGGCGCGYDTHTDGKTYKYDVNGNIIEQNTLLGNL